MREHLESLERQTRETPPELIGPDLPEGAAHVLGWFGELNRTRSNNGFGPNPIGYQDIASWSQLTGTRPGTMEVDWIMALDGAFLALAAKQAKAKK